MRIRHTDLVPKRSVRPTYVHPAPESGVGSADRRILAKNSPAAGSIKNVRPNPHVTGLIVSGASMNVKYKETARGGLAVNIIEC